MGKKPCLYDHRLICGEVTFAACIKTKDFLNSKDSSSAGHVGWTLKEEGKMVRKKEESIQPKRLSNVFK